MYLIYVFYVKSNGYSWKPNSTVNPTDSLSSHLYVLLLINRYIIGYC